MIDVKGNSVMVAILFLLMVKFLAIDISYANQ